MSGDVKFTVHKVRVFWAPHPLRHPIRWWKTRPLRRLMNEPRTELERELDEALDRAFIYGEESR